jgi:hypothetical protein
MEEGWSCVPAIVIVTVDVEDLLALDTQDTAMRSVEVKTLVSLQSSPGKDTFRQTWSEGVSSGDLATWSCGVEGRTGAADENIVFGGNLIHDAGMQR